MIPQTPDLTPFFDNGWNSVAFVDLKAIGNNLKYLRSMEPPSTLQLAVVKANAYGHGAVTVSKSIESSVDWFAVANIMEAIELRENGISKPIMVFGPPEAAHNDLYISHQITAVISDLIHFERLKNGTSYHLKFDTGLGRVGILPEQLGQAQKAILSHPQLKYDGLMTHFATSENPVSEAFGVQLQRFEKIRSAIGHGVMVHVANSGGIICREGVGYDMVRAGLSLYGYDPTGMDNKNLTPALQWWSRFSQVKRLEKGEGVSYSHTWKLPHAGWIGVIPVGYADGLFRSLSNKISFWSDGEDRPQIGNITMDQTMAFLDQARLDTHTPVMIMGGDGHQSVQHFARTAGTIAHEILCAMGNRILRVYD